MRRGSWPITSGARSSIAPTTPRVWNSSVASPRPTRPATSVSTRTKIQLRRSALTTTVLIAVIFISSPSLSSPSGQRLAADTPLDERLQDDRDHDDKPESKLGVEGVDSGRDDAGVDRADNVGGDERADDRAGAAEHRGPAEEDRRDGV